MALRVITAAKTPDFSELLVSERKATPDLVERARARAKTQGGSLAAHLVAVGIDEAAVTEALARAHQLPVAPPGSVEAALKSPHRSLLPEERARGLGAAPLGVVHGKPVIAFSTPVALLAAGSAQDLQGHIGVLASERQIHALLAATYPPAPRAAPPVETQPPPMAMTGAGPARSGGFGQISSSPPTPQPAAAVPTPWLDAEPPPAPLATESRFASFAAPLAASVLGMEGDEEGGGASRAAAAIAGVAVVVVVAVFLGWPIISRWFVETVDDTPAEELIQSGRLSEAREVLRRSWRGTSDEGERRRLIRRISEVSLQLAHDAVSTALEDTKAEVAQTPQAEATALLQDVARLQVAAQALQGASRAAPTTTPSGAAAAGTGGPTPGTPLSSPIPAASQPSVRPPPATELSPPAARPSTPAAPWSPPPPSSTGAGAVPL